MGIGATLGAWLRWAFGMTLNHIFPTIPLGNLNANLVGGFLIGIFMAITRNHTFIPKSARLAVNTRCLGGLTTFSTFSAETMTLITHQKYAWTSAIIMAHVGGSILATLLAIF